MASRGDGADYNQLKCPLSHQTLQRPLKPRKAVSKASESDNTTVLSFR